MEYDEPFNDNSSKQTDGIDVDKYYGTLTYVIAIKQRQRLAIRCAIRRQLLSVNHWDSCLRVEAMRDPLHYSTSIAACKPLIPIGE